MLHIVYAANNCMLHTNNSRTTCTVALSTGVNLIQIFLSSPTTCQICLMQFVFLPQLHAEDNLHAADTSCKEEVQR